ncbi:thioredoxin-dependent thiol peroxidase [Candidatus Peregrinibacteria bacterium CG10_big_fil_rev_8_21_14_0_10_36_19]|nr:MAG: thioredoxin-dependent thiol peroxidase [Candidatus Peregrinibacteria bacterium CG10_big_fil_rev_8_21_14_0_10_36_19]
MKAPNFNLLDQDGKMHNLSDYKGKKVLLYFYPKDMTSGCTVEAQSFRDNLDELKSRGVVVFGVSKDDVKSHKKFCEKESLNFDLLSDESTEVCMAYGVWVEKSMYGKKYMGIQRESFLIDENGEIIKHYEKVKPEEHVAEILADLN